MNKKDEHAILDKMAYRFTAPSAYIRGSNTNKYLTKKDSSIVLLTFTCIDLLHIPDFITCQCIDHQVPEKMIVRNKL